MFNHKIYFNNIPLPSFILLKSIKVQILPNMNNITLETEFGQKLQKTTFGTKIIQLQVSFLKDDTLPKFQQQQELLEWIKGNDWKESKLILPDNSEVYYMAICNNLLELENTEVESITNIEFLICNPCRISNVEYISYGTINYLANVETYSRLELKVKNACEEIKINFKNNKFDNYIRLRHNFLSNDIIVIDFETKKIKVNDEVKMQILTLDSKFHKIIKGENIYSLERGSCDLKVYYREKYI